MIFYTPTLITEPFFQRRLNHYKLKNNAHKSSIALIYLISLCDIPSGGLEIYFSLITGENTIIFYSNLIKHVNVIIIV